MRSNYKQLGQFIRPVDVRNHDLSVSRLLGVSIAKEFIPSIANTVGTDMSSYKIVRKGQFAYGPVTSRNGDKISVALLREEECIISSAYTAFEITDTNKLDPEYLMLWFSRPEFDRYARYHSHGSVREIFGWDEMCRVELPVPDIEEQRQIVREVNRLNAKISLNSKTINSVEESAKSLFRAFFITHSLVSLDLVQSWPEGVLSDRVEIRRGASPRPIQDYVSDSGFNWLKISDASATEGPYITRIKEKIKPEGISQTVSLTQGNLVLSNSATPGMPKILEINTCIHDGWLYFPKSEYSVEFLYLLFLNIREQLIPMANGSVFTNLKTEIVKAIPILHPDLKTLGDFNRLVKSHFKLLKSLAVQNEKLSRVRELLLAGRFK